MEFVTEFLKNNPQVFGIFFAILGVAGLLAAIFDSDWLFKNDVSGVTYSLKKIDGWINMFGRKTARVVVGLGSISLIAAGAVWFYIYTFCMK